MSLEIFVIVFSCFVCHCFLLHYDFIISHFQSLVYIFLWCFMGGNSPMYLPTFVGRCFHTMVYHFVALALFLWRSTSLIISSISTDGVHSPTTCIASVNLSAG